MSTETVGNVQQRQPPRFMNKVMAWLMRTPLHGIISQHIMLITFRGRKSGKLFTTPIGYMRQGKSVISFTDHLWWKNLVTQPEVSLLIQGKQYRGTAEAIRDEEETVASALSEYCVHSPRAAQAFHVELDTSGKPVPESVRREARRLTLVRVTLQ